MCPVFHNPVLFAKKTVVLVDDNTTPSESGKLCSETAVASTHLCCHQILLFQSPYTGTEQCGQVLFLIDVFSIVLQFTICSIECDLNLPFCQILL